MSATLAVGLLFEMRHGAWGMGMGQGMGAGHGSAYALSFVPIMGSGMGWRALDHVGAGPGAGTGERCGRATIPYSPQRKNVFCVIV